MADVNPKVMDMIRTELEKNPDLSNKELFEKAKSVDKSVGALSPRQFNARYPLQVKRTMGPKKKSSRRKAKKAAPGTGKKTARAGRAAPKPTRAETKRAEDRPDRDRVRKVMLELARDVANAQGKGDVVDVIMGIERYVDRVIKAAG
jgi:hypothetical protein